MEIMIPGSDQDPGAEQTGAVEFVDIFFDNLPEQDRKDLILFVKILSRPLGVPFVKWPKRFQVGTLNWLKKGGLPRITAVAAQLKMAYFALHAMTMTAYYSNFATPEYEGEMPWQQVGFDVPDSMIPEGALDHPELAHIKRWKERQKIKEGVQ